jgi:mono/diheme cytochrome c family protein
MKRTILHLLWISAAVFACNTPAKTSEDKAAASSAEAMVARGKYLADVMDCANCHSPKVMTPQGPVPDSTRLMAGHWAADALPPYDPSVVAGGQWALMSSTVTAFVGPWGTSYAANLTPDATGIGSWSQQQFRKALKQGLYKGLDHNRPIMPPMPVQAFKNLSDEDADAIFAYLKTLKPVHNLVPSYTPPTALASQQVIGKP